MGTVAVARVVAGDAIPLLDEAQAGVDAVHVDVAQQAAVAVDVVPGAGREGDPLTADDAAQGVAGLGEAALARLRRVDADEPDLAGHAVPGRPDGVAVHDLRHGPARGGGSRPCLRLWPCRLRGRGR